MKEEMDQVGHSHPQIPHLCMQSVADKIFTERITQQGVERADWVVRAVTAKVYGPEFKFLESLGITVHISVTLL